VAVDKYGAGSFLCGSNSDDADAEDVGFVMLEEKGGDEDVQKVGRSVVRWFGVDDVKVSWFDWLL
jgi:hypothetical protein